MEEIQKSLSPTVDTVVVFANRVWLEYLALASIQQAMAIVVTFGMAVIVHRAVGKFIRKVAPDMGNARWRRAIQTVSSISMSIVWVISLWLVLFIFGELGWKTSMIRLVASLINAWVVIRVASALIPSPFWSRIFAWFAWSIAALNAIGQLDPLDGQFRAHRRRTEHNTLERHSGGFGHGALALVCFDFSAICAG